MKYATCLMFLARLLYKHVLMDRPIMHHASRMYVVHTAPVMGVWAV